MTSDRLEAIRQAEMANLRNRGHKTYADRKAILDAQRTDYREAIADLSLAKSNVQRAKQELRSAKQEAVPVRKQVAYIKREIRAMARRENYEEITPLQAELDEHEANLLALEQVVPLLVGEVTGAEQAHRDLVVRYTELKSALEDAKGQKTWDEFKRRPRARQYGFRSDGRELPAHMSDPDYAAKLAAQQEKNLERLKAEQKETDAWRAKQEGKQAAILAEQEEHDSLERGCF